MTKIAYLKIAYLQCPTGLAGDMCLGALVDAGVPLDYLTQHLNQLGIGHEYKLWRESVLRNGQAATKVHVELLASENGHATDQEPGVDPYPTFAHAHPHPHPHSVSHSLAHPPAVQKTGKPWSSSNQNALAASEQSDAHSQTRHLPEIETLIRAAHLPPRAESWSLAVFRKLAEAEGAVHGIAPEQVHFHEVGATDAIVDIVGTCLGFDWLGIAQLYCSALPVGGGTVRAAHGLLPVPTPAVLKLWEMRQVPIYSNGIERELVTPTGAAIATTLATDFGPPPAMTLHKVGLGAGSRDLPIPNIVRLWLGEIHSGENRQSASTATTLRPTPGAETVCLLETQIDDLSPQAIAYTQEQLFKAGALDVFAQPVMMKKSRLGTLLSVICPLERVQECETIVFRETTTLGIRRSVQERTTLDREIEPVQTIYGKVRVKIARHPQSHEVLNAQPEYEDCARLAQEQNVSFQEIHQTAVQQWKLENSGDRPKP